jgi:hypothetical protein
MCRSSGIVSRDYRAQAGLGRSAALAVGVLWPDPEFLSERAGTRLQAPVAPRPKVTV